MAKNISTEIFIAAPSQLVWDTLVNLDDYEFWNPFFIKSSGVIQAVGDKLSIKLINGKTITPTVKVIEFAKELRWEGAILGNWFFGGSHYFRLMSDTDNTTRVKHGEDFWGVMPTIAPSFIRGIKVNYEEVNIALKRHCEASMSL